MRVLVTSWNNTCHQENTKIGLHNWVTLMLHYEFEIIYKKGKQNVVVDGI